MNGPGTRTRWADGFLDPLFLDPEVAGQLRGGLADLESLGHRVNGNAGASEPGRPNASRGSMTVHVG